MNPKDTSTSSEHEISVSQFFALHEAQLTSNGVPKLYWNSLHSKIANNVSSMLSFNQKMMI